MPKIMSDYYPLNIKVQLLTAPIAAPMQSKLGKIAFNKLKKPLTSIVLIH